MDIEQFMMENGIEINDKVEIEKGGLSYFGRLMPSSGDEIAVLKLENGYNIGINIVGCQATLIEKSVEGEKPIEREVVGSGSSDKTVSMLLTGGTIASRVDYRTGGVSSDLSIDEIVSAIPELEGMANYRFKVVSNILSENIRPEDWVEISRAVYQEVEAGADGVVVAHGTDTMALTASAVSFLIDTPVPIVFVGSQRSADRPSSDNVLNAISAVKLAKSDIAEVMVVMHGETSDTYCLAHKATKTRKMHTSRRDAFRSINTEPIAKIRDEVTAKTSYTSRDEVELSYNGGLNPNIGLLKFTPTTKPETLRHYLDTMDGVVIEGTGLGHVSKQLIPTIKEGIAQNTPVVMTSQCLYGRVCNRVYDTGRDLIKAGVIPGKDMLPETAMVKLMWVTEQTSDMNKIKRLMTTNIAGEITSRSIPDKFLK
ncbi:L-asparaginase/archaeal Glu-tRNAGln amidotransferase subunit D AnsB [Methanonatronarchaeum thermophilum]|uniref:Glutamyl-tRNA(Gln) amidotransferase subunit D n=1 Tax=Methanonatronarchaeum thermophilum TaxID=1927129 RepID=A0A1Y3GG52_9EURY|nr:Glu-tRNA(Gln) amidotransferase subunit GatD [Methanonatronarchaeum thermophilum]OUJ19184.1 L-asparaginase/archaeal Glu-tRNAGln amidotransferase subunit D AnsB [Methanonatronarchaeum thermophilum]